MRFLSHENMRDAAVPFVISLFFYMKARNVHEAEITFLAAAFGIAMMRTLLYLGNKIGR